MSSLLPFLAARAVGEGCEGADGALRVGLTAIFLFDSVRPGEDLSDPGVLRWLLSVGADLRRCCICDGRVLCLIRPGLPPAADGCANVLNGAAEALDRVGDAALSSKSSSPSSSASHAGNRGMLLSRIALSNRLLVLVNVGWRSRLPSAAASLLGERDKEAMLMGLGSAIWMSIGLGATSCAFANVRARVKGVRLDFLSGLCRWTSGESSNEREVTPKSSSASPIVFSETARAGPSQEAGGVEERVYGGACLS